MKTAKIEKQIGFTLIELLVVISIIGILSTLLVANFNAIRERARDVQRKSDLKQYQTSLETYANTSGGYYPNSSGKQNAASTLCNSLSMTNCPDDPLSPNQEYSYISTSSDYTIWADMEASKDIWVICSSGKSGSVSIGSEPSSATCPF